MKPQTQIRKPVLNIAEALTFATGGTSAPSARGSLAKKSKASTRANQGARVFFAPEGDKRLTINLKDELHKKLKIAAIEQGSTAGDIIEALIKKHL